MDKKLSFGRVCFRVMLLCILNVCSGGFNFFVHSLKFSSRVTKCFVSPAELMCSTDPHPPTLKFRNKNGSNKTRLFLVYLSLKSLPNPMMQFVTLDFVIQPLQIKKNLKKIEFSNVIFQLHPFLFSFNALYCL